jgi:hypothetical protein
LRGASGRFRSVPNRHFPDGHYVKGGDGGSALSFSIETTVSSIQRKGVLSMTQNEKEMIESLAEEAEIILEEGYEKKDLKEKRGITKNTLYDGSKKLKHSIPKGKHLK